MGIDETFLGMSIATIIFCGAWVGSFSLIKNRPIKWVGIIASMLIIWWVSIPILVKQYQLENMPPTQRIEEETPKESILQEQKNEYGLIKDGGFEEDFYHWERDRVRAPGVTSADQTLAQRITRDVFYIDPFGLRGKSLTIENPKPKTPNEPFKIRQKIYGLKPNTQYELNFFMRGSANSQDSLKIVLGDYWFADQKSYQVAGGKYEDWEQQTAILQTKHETEADFWIISDDIANLRVDDITLELLNKDT